MTPVVTLYHFVEPSWFTDLGGFERAENISLFVDWACKMIREYGRYSRMWVTFNEPTVKSTFGYVVGNHPPGKMLHFTLGGRVILNQLLAHIEVYKRAKLDPEHPIPTTPAQGAPVAPTTRQRGKKGGKAGAAAAAADGLGARADPLHEHGARSPSDLQIGLVHNYFEYNPLGEGLLYTWARVRRGHRHVA